MTTEELIAFAKEVGFSHIDAIRDLVRSLNPTQTIAEALKTYVTTGKLPPLPEADLANG